MKLGTLVHHVHGYQTCLRFFNFCLRLSLWSFKVKKRGKIITKLWKIITKSLGKIKKSEASLCRSTLLLSFCENRFCLSQLIKNVKFDEARCLFSTFLRLQGDHHCACAQKWCHFSFFFQELSNKKKIKALRPKMTKIASRGSCLNYWIAWLAWIFWKVCIH